MSEQQDIFGLFADLAAPFDPAEVKIRTQANRQLHYITARTAMNRLDDVVGPQNWWDDYVPLEHSVLCKLTIRLPDGTTITKSDAGGYAGMADPGDDDKSGYADAFKRACVKFGVGRYLYRDGVPAFVREMLRGKGGEDLVAKPQSSPPPSSAPRNDDRSSGRAEVNRQFAPSGNGGGNGGGRQFDPGEMPKSGRALFAWCKKQQENTGKDYVALINDIGTGMGLPKKMIDWSEQQIGQVWSRINGGGDGSRQPVGAAAAGAPTMQDEDGTDIPF